MFFRHVKPHINTFNERVENVKKFGISAQPDGPGRVRVKRDGIAAIVTDVPTDRPHVDRAGLEISNDIGALVNAGYQQYWLTPSGKRVPARAGQLKALHGFEEDLKEGLGLPSLYNTSLGTISALHLYDRVEDRDDTVHPQRPWERKAIKTPAA